MHLSYKLNDGRYANLYDLDVLRAEYENAEHFYGETTWVKVTTGDGELAGDSCYVNVLKDRTNNKFYFAINDQKIYVSDFEYLEASELVDKLQKNEEIPFYLFISSLIKESDKLAFIEDREVPSSVGFLTRAYPYDSEHRKVICKLVERNFMKAEWGFKFETEPIDASENEKYGCRYNYAMGYYDSILKGSRDVILKSDIIEHRVNYERPYSKKRAK